MKTAAVAPDSGVRHRVDASARARYRFGETLTHTHPEGNIRNMCEHYDNWERLIFPELWAIKREKQMPPPPVHIALEIE